VFLAVDEFPPHVAIKRVRLPTAGRERARTTSAALLRRRGGAGGPLQHPNVVQIFDAVDDPAQPYLVMEYVPGVTLRRFCRPDALLPLDQIVEIGFKCAMALAYVATARA
jgi:serine/threonine protein kinase